MNSDLNNTSNRNEGRLVISKNNATTNKDEISIKKVKKKDPITLNLLQAIQVINPNSTFLYTKKTYGKFIIELRNSIKLNIYILLLDTKKEYKG